MRVHSCLVLLLVATAALVSANENPSLLAKPLVEESESKVKIIDQSRLLTADEVAKLSEEEKKAIPVVEPSLKKPSLVIPKGELVKPDEHLAVDPPAPAQEENAAKNEKLPPIPVMFPSFFNGLFNPPVVVNSLPSVDEADSTDSSKPKGIMSILLLKSHRIDSNDALHSSQPENTNDGTVKSSFVIMRFLPKSVGSIFGLNSDEQLSPLFGGGDDDVDKKREHRRQHLLGGGDDDVDKKRAHLLGGESDPDRILRIPLDKANKGVFTGGNDDVYNSPMNQHNQHRMFVFSMFDRIRSMFDQMRRSIEGQVQGDDQSGLSETGSANNLVDSVPFISIRTDDGKSALIPNEDIGYAEKQQRAEQSLNKCMMLQFMRLKASMYYRTILHLLFFAGCLLFVLSLLMWSWRVCRRRQLARRHRHHHHHHHPHPHPHPHPHMSVSSIESAGAAKSKLAAYKAWQGLDQSSLIEPSDKVVLIQAPPAYDQVFIHDKNSTLISSSRPSYTAVALCDECETKSLPPEYEEKPKQQNN